MNSIWTFPKKSPEFLKPFDFQHLWEKYGKSARAVHKIVTLNGTYRGML